MYLIWLVLGAVGGATLCWVGSSDRHHDETRFFGVALVIAALIYVVFSILAMDIRWIFVESFGLLVFGLLAFLGIRYSALLISLGWLLHPVWDVGLHVLGPGRLIAPEWYALICVSFDWVVGSWIAYRALRYAKN